MREIRARYLFARREVRGADAPLASATRDGVILRQDLDQSVWNPGDDVSMYKLVEPGDFVIGLRSFQHGLSASGVRGLVSPAYTVLRAISRDVDVSFFAHYFRSAPFINILEELSQGIRQGRTIPYEGFANLRLPVPALEEQRRIADFLDEQVALLDRGADLRRQQAKLLAQRAVVSIDEALDRAQGRDFRLVPLRYLAGIIDTEHKTAPDVPGGGFWVAGTGAVRSGQLLRERLYETDRASYLGWTRRGRPKPGDLFLTREAPVGEVALLRQDDPQVCIGQRVVLIKVTPELRSEHLLNVLLAPRTARFYTDVTQGSLHPHLNMRDIGSIPVPLADHVRQQALVEEVNRQRADAQLAASCLERAAVLLRERKQALITAAVTGQFDVTTARRAA